MPSEQPPTRVGTCTFCGGDGVVTRSFGINDSGRPEIVPCPSCQPAPPSEQSREGEERVYTIWLCGECKAGPQEPTKGGWVCGECGASDRTNYLDQAKVVRREPAQPQVEKLESRIYELIVERDSAVAALVAHQAYTFTCDNCGHSMHKRPISGPEATGSVAAPESGEGLRLTEDAGRGPDRPASPTEQGEARAYPGGKP